MNYQFTTKKAKRAYYVSVRKINKEYKSVSIFFAMVDKTVNKMIKLQAKQDRINAKKSKQPKEPKAAKSPKAPKAPKLSKTEQMTI